MHPVAKLIRTVYQIGNDGKSWQEPEEVRTLRNSKTIAEKAWNSHRPENYETVYFIHS